MGLCKLYQQGNCPSNSKCVNEHFDVKEIIKTDVESAVNGKLWPLSTYGPFINKPSLPNFIEDQSFEEIRMLYYEAKLKDFFGQCRQQFAKEALDASNKMKALLQMTPDIIDVVIKVYDTPSDTSCSGATTGKTANTAINNPFSATNAGSIFAKSNTAVGNNNIFGNTTANAGGFGSTSAVGKSIFGPATNNNTTSSSIFGNNTAFGGQQQQQQSSIFGQTTMTANSIFGGGTANNQQMNSIFGQQQPQTTVPTMRTNLFASAAQQQQQQPPQFGLFSQQNQQQPQQPFIFGQQNQSDITDLKLDMKDIKTNLEQLATSVNRSQIQIRYEIKDALGTITNTLSKLVEQVKELTEKNKEMLQAQFDKEYNEDLKRIEKAHNKQSKVTVCLDKYRKPYVKDVGEELEDDYVEEDEWARDKRSWDRFETNERLLEAIPKCGCAIDKEGEMITKRDPDLCGVRNACRMMSFPTEFATGNRVFNQLQTHSRKNIKKNVHMQDRKDNTATTEMGIDGRTRLLLYKLINNQVLEQINGIISTGKEAVILHANTDPNCMGDSSIVAQLMPKECAVKIFKTALNDFKQRDRYIKDDYRFKDRFNVRFSKQNNTIIINMWAEKEMHNLMRMQTAGINCPEVVILKNHLLVMSFIGENGRAAPKLKDAFLTEAEWITAYDEVVETMHKLYNKARLIHADLNEFNILWHDGKCWFIDVAQAVHPTHTSALEFLMRDCNNITTFFSKKGVPNCHTKEALFEHITSLNAETHNVAMLERIQSKGAYMQEATAPNLNEFPLDLRPLEYPFEAAWEKSVEARKKPSSNNIITDNAANALNIIKVEGYPETSVKQSLDDKPQISNAVKSVSDTATN